MDVLFSHIKDIGERLVPLVITTRFDLNEKDATAILDRLLHHCTPVTIMGDSYRLREAKKNKLLTGN